MLTHIDREDKQQQPWHKVADLAYCVFVCVHACARVRFCKCLNKYDLNDNIQEGEESLNSFCVLTPVDKIRLFVRVRVSLVVTDVELTIHSKMKFKNTKTHETVKCHLSQKQTGLHFDSCLHYQQCKLLLTHSSCVGKSWQLTVRLIKK